MASVIKKVTTSDNDNNEVIDYPVSEEPENIELCSFIEYHCTCNGHDKKWAISVPKINDNILFTVYGAAHGKKRFYKKTFSNHHKLVDYLDKKVNEKLNKGYIVVSNNRHYSSSELIFSTSNI
jgi:hypothetical protein